MSKLEELIEQYCPDGVEYVPLSSIGTIKRGNGLQKKDFVKAGIGCIHYGQIYTKFGLFTNKTLTYVDKELADHLLHIEKGDLVIACTSENVEDVCKAVAWLGDDSIVTGGHSCVLHHNQNPKYIAYFFQTESFQRQKRKYAYGTKVIDIKPDSIGKIEIPLPPLPVQEEIVRVLDTFTELQAELQAELQKRKQQYNYYLDNLLNFKDISGGGYQAEVRWMKLKDVCMKTSNIKWKSTTGQYRYIDLSSVDIQTHSIISTIEIDKMSAPSRAQQIVQEDDVIFATTRPTQMRACIIPTQYNGDICSTGYCVLRVDTKILLPRFLFFSLTVSGFKTYLSNNLTLGNYPSISNNTLLEYEVPVPSLANQQRIVAILDRFDRLTNDLNAGLPAEIEKRRQQYEYYRDKLLTFKRKGA